VLPILEEDILEEESEQNLNSDTVASLFVEQVKLSMITSSPKL